MAKIKTIISILAFFLVSDIHSQTLNTPACDSSKEECFTYEYFGDTNRNGKAHGKGRMVWENGLEVEGRWVNGDIVEGRSTFSDGSSYEGEYKNYQHHGYGERYWPKGGSYKGRWKNGKQHGKGVQIYKGMEDVGIWVIKYDGQFLEDKPNGNASITYSDGSSYKGKVTDGDRDGYGEYIYPDRESTYKGYWKENKLHGSGVQQLANGTIIDGYWKESLLDGFVKITYENGRTFNGVFKNNKKNGYGEEILKDMSSGYKGQFKDDVWHGQGELLFYDGSTYIGTFKEGLITKGRRVFEDGSTYKGGFKDTLFHGMGSFNSTAKKNSYKYTGNFEEGKMSGTGRKIWESEGRTFQYSGGFKNNAFEGSGDIHLLDENGAIKQRVYLGDFKNSEYHGNGRMTRWNGDEITGFIRGKFKDGVPHGDIYDEFTKDGVKTTFTGKYDKGMAKGYAKSYEITEEYTFLYEGDHQNGKRLGKATITVTDNKSGEKLIKKGNFSVTAAMDGYGEIQYPSGAKDKGFFEDDIMIEGTMTGAIGINWGAEIYLIGHIIEGGAAQDSGLMIGDKIIAIKEKNSDWTYLSDLSKSQKFINAPLRLRNGSIFDLKVQRGSGSSVEEKVFKIKSKSIKISRKKNTAKFNNTPRVALIIGNSNYQSSSLDNPINDAELMKKSLEDKGFQIILKLDTDKEDFKKAVWEFGDLIEESGPNTTALFFYSGHGMQVNGENYLIPLGAKIKRLREVEVEAISADLIMNALAIAENGIKIMILDACRDNPFKSFTRNLQQGLAEMDSPTGTIIAYSTAPGRTALDGGFDYDNSIYTKNLTESMDVYDLKIEEVFKRTRKEVERTTEGDQVPWESSSLLGDFYFNKIN